jgi:mono/diheme cytochrome c family protein
MRRLGAVLCLLLAADLAHAWPRSHREHGASLFAGNGCLQCHRMLNTGGRKGPDLSAVGRQLKRKQMLAQIREGGNGMPAFGGVLPDAEIADIVAYLRSCRGPAKKYLPKGQFFSGRIAIAKQE